MGMNKLVYIGILFAGMAFHCSAQPVDELIRRAYVQYSEKNYDAAANDIDEVLRSKKGEGNAMAWHIRGFIYKDIYINDHNADPKSIARETAVNSLMQSMELDKEASFKENNTKALYYLAGSYWDDASYVIDARDAATIESAVDFFERYRVIAEYIQQDGLDIQEMNIRFYLAMATAHRKIYEKSREVNEYHYNKANEYYLKVLEINPDDWPALYSVAVLYYNDAAYKLENLPEMDIPDVMKVQGESMRTIQFALPFMMRAYEVNPERIEAIKGLKYILFNLHDYEKSDFFDEKLQELEKHQK